MNDRLNAWRRLQYHDPAVVLRELRKAAQELTAATEAMGITLDERSLRLRTTGLKKYREWRDAAIFTYGMGLSKQVRMGYATDEAEDYDFVTSWMVEDQPFFCPVQLKELPPADLNAKATLVGIMDSLKDKYAEGTDAVLAVKLSRKPEIDLTAFRSPDAPFREVYFFWQTTPDLGKYVLYGDLKGEPGAFEYSYPD